jgi:L-histidine N-alpha-methyltransferase
MPIVYKDISEEQAISTARESINVFLIDVKLGLSQTKKTIPPKYLYDNSGSEIFQKITQLEDYYPYNCEKELLELNKTKIINSMGSTFNLIDLGAGDGSKTMILIKEALAQKKDITYVPIDISRGSN